MVPVPGAAPGDMAGASMRRSGATTMIERPETPPRVRAELKEGRAHYQRLEAKMDKLEQAQQRHEAQAREDLTSAREERREMDRRLDALSASQARGEERLAALSAAVVELRTGQKEGWAEAVERERARVVREEAMAGQLARILGAMAMASAVARDRAGTADPGGEGGALVAAPMSQSRRGAVAGVGGLSLATILAIVAALGSLPVAVQWVLIVVASAAGLGAVVVGVRWGWRIAGGSP